MIQTLKLLFYKIENLLIDDVVKQWRIINQKEIKRKGSKGYGFNNFYKFCDYWELKKKIVPFNLFLLDREIAIIKRLLI